MAENNNKESLLESVENMMHKETQKAYKVYKRYGITYESIFNSAYLGALEAL